MVVLGGLAVSYERGIPVKGGSARASRGQRAAWGRREEEVHADEGPKGVFLGR